MHYYYCWRKLNTHDGSSLSVFSVVVETGDDIFDIIQRHGGNGVFPGVDSEWRAPDHVKLHLDVRRLLLLELKVPKTVRKDRLGLGLADGQVSKGGAVWWKGKPIVEPSLSCNKRRTKAVWNEFGFLRSATKLWSRNKVTTEAILICLLEKRKDVSSRLVCVIFSCFPALSKVSILPSLQTK